LLLDTYYIVILLYQLLASDQWHELRFKMTLFDCKQTVQIGFPEKSQANVVRE